MKKLFIILGCVLALSVFTGCLGGNSSTSSSKTVVKSQDGTQKVNIVGEWKATEKNGYFYKMIFTSDGKFTYGCGNPRAKSKITVDDFGGLEQDKEFNIWLISGTYKISGNVLIFSDERVKDFYNNISDTAGSTNNYVVNIVDEDELVITTSGTGSVRTYCRQ